MARRPGGPNSSTQTIAVVVIGWKLEKELYWARMMRVAAQCNQVTQLKVGRARCMQYSACFHPNAHTAKVSLCM